MNSMDIESVFHHNPMANCIQDLAKSIASARTVVNNGIICMIAKHGGDLDEALKSATTAYDAETLVQAGADANTPAGKAAVLEAAKNGRSDVIRVLLQHGAHADSEALLIAVTMRNALCVFTLVHHGVHSDSRMAYIAAANGDIDILDKIVDMEDMDTVKAVMYAAIRTDNADLVKKVMMESKVNNFVTPDMLMKATADVLEIIVGQHYSVNNLDMLMAAIMEEDLQVVNALLRADNGICAEDFGPALYIAVDVGNLDIVVALLDEGADITFDVIRAAQACGNEDVTKVIMDKMAAP